MCCQNITCLKIRAFPGGAGLWGQLWLEPCVPQVSSEGWVLARQCLRHALQPPTAERILAGGCSPQGNLRDVKGCCWWILNEHFYSLGIFFSVYLSWWWCVLMCWWRSAEGPETWTFLEFKVLVFQDFCCFVSLSAVFTDFTVEQIILVVIVLLLGWM